MDECGIPDGKLSGDNRYPADNLQEVSKVYRKSWKLKTNTSEAFGMTRFLGAVGITNDGCRVHKLHQIVHTFTLYRVQRAAVIS